MALVAIKPACFAGDPSLAFYNRFADISVFICLDPTTQDSSGHYYKLTVVGNLEGLPDESIHEYAEAAWSELVTAGESSIEVTHIQEQLTATMVSRLCIVKVASPITH